MHVHQDTAQQMRQLSLVPLVHVTFFKHSISCDNFDVMEICKINSKLNRYLPKEDENRIEQPKSGKHLK